MVYNAYEREDARSEHEARTTKAAAAQASGAKLLDAAVHVIRSKGYSAARVEDICAEAGLTKGAFFHHFASKEACAIAAAAHFAANADALFDAAPYSALCPTRETACSAMSISARRSFRASCRSSPASSARWCRRPTTPIPPSAPPATATSASTPTRLGADIAEAKARYAPDAAWTPESAALFSQAVLQGAFILAKAKHGPEVAADCLDHLKRYFEAPASRRRGGTRDVVRVSRTRRRR